jgi:hypothetical protein
MRESRTYGSVRGACDETHVPTASGSFLRRDVTRLAHPDRGWHGSYGRQTAHAGIGKMT